MIDRILDWFKVYSRKREAQTERDGFLSYAGEFHALALGLGIGFVAAMRQDPEIMSAFIAVTLGIGALDEGKRRLKQILAKIGKEEEAASALGELQREPWYGLGGSMVSFIATAIAVYGADALSDMLTFSNMVKLF